MEPRSLTLDPLADRRAWLRPAGLFVLTLVVAVCQPSVLLGIPFLALTFTLGVRRVGVGILAALAALMTFGGGMRDGFWYLERGWGLILGGCFAAATLRRPAAAFTQRALTAVAATTGGAVLFFGMRSGAWEAVEWMVRERLIQGMSLTLETLTQIRGGEALSPTLVTTIRQSVEVQSAVFPALLGLASMSALGVAWWTYQRLVTGGSDALRPVREFRFNDHLVWFLIGGLALLVLRWGEGGGMVGANAVVFMGALYALRGAAVMVFLSGGLSLVGYALVAFGLLFVPPLILAGAMVVGVGDTWIDVRTRMDSDSPDEQG